MFAVVEGKLVVVISRFESMLRADVTTSSGDNKIYIGMTEHTFKTQYNNHGTCTLGNNPLLKGKGHIRTKGWF